MFDFNQPDQTKIQTQFLAKALRNTPLTLPMADHQKLQEHLDDCDCARNPDLKPLAYVLANKLMNTRPVDEDRNSGVVIGESCVTYAVDAQMPQTALLTHRTRAGQQSNVIAVASLLGATLIGMRVGQRAPLLLNDDTIGRLCIIDVQCGV